MSRRVFILQSDQQAAKTLGAYFTRHGDQAWLVSTAQHARGILEAKHPDLALIDLHLPESTWLDILVLIQQQFPETQVILTNRKPDIRLELLAKEHGGRVFLRAPFTPVWIEKAMAKLEALTPVAPSGPTQTAPAAPKLPPVRVPMRVKITLPYILLALAFLSLAAYLSGRYLLQSMQERFTSQLIDAGRLASDWMVQQENRTLETVRLIANSEGIAEAMHEQSSERLRALLLPLAVNYEEEDVEILNTSGMSLLSLHRPPGSTPADFRASKGETLFASLDFVQKVLVRQADQQGDKYAGMEHTPWGDMFYIAGPVLDRQGNLAGVVLVGRSLTTLVRQMRQDTLAHLTIYAPDGVPEASTLFLTQEVVPLEAGLANRVLLRQEQDILTRDLKIASASYSELLSSWEVRGGQDLGILGVSLARNFFIEPNLGTRIQVLLVVLSAFFGILIIGSVIARQITHPLARVVEASTQVAGGNFKVKVPSEGNDEIMVLAHAFNYMVAGLQEGIIYRDLLGRTVSPEVREALRQSIVSGGLRLEGHSATATVLMSDIRDFTSIAEKEEPTTILNWLNEYFGELVPIVARYGGVVDKFEGDAMLSFFGILPTSLPSNESAYHACQAAVAMLAKIEEINQVRALRGEPALITGIGINTGVLTAGSLGTADRLNYTIIGDPVNTTQRMQNLTRTYGESAVVVGEHTLTALQGRRGEFRFEPLGRHAFRGKSDLIWVYRLQPASANRPGRNGASAEQVRQLQQEHERQSS